MTKPRMIVTPHDGAWLVIVSDDHQAVVVAREALALDATLIARAAAAALGLPVHHHPAIEENR